MHLYRSTYYFMTMQKMTPTLVISATIAAILIGTVGTTVSYQKAVAGASNAQGQCYSSQNKSFHQKQVLEKQ
jgi:hypothetical protein